jgi:nucleotide-binding universal stress UspA family protein
VPVLVATDLTDDRSPVIHLAAGLGKGGGIHLLHVAPAGLPEGELALRRERLEAEAFGLRQRGLNPTVHLEIGDAPETILAAAWSLEASMVAMGGAAGQRRLGAVAAAVVRASPVPVLVARGAPDEVPTQLRVFVAVDFSPAAAIAAQWARGVAGGSVHLAHVWEPMAMRARLGLAKVIEAESPPDQVRDVLERDCRTVGGDDNLPVHLAPILPDEDAATALLNLATRQGADVLVLGAHGRRGGPGSLMDQVLRNSTLPVVTVPDRLDDHPLPVLKRVVVAVDHSELSEDAVAYAFSLAGPRGIVHLVNVRDASYDGVDAERARDLIERDRLMALVPEAGRAAGTAILAHPVTGVDPAAVVTRLAERLVADAIVVGGQPHSAVYSALIGSFVDALLRSTRRPVMIIRPRESA